jgi:hypothetical protein
VDCRRRAAVAKARGDPLRNSLGLTVARGVKNRDGFRTRLRSSPSDVTAPLRKSTLERQAMGIYKLRGSDIRSATPELAQVRTRAGSSHAPSSGAAIGRRGDPEDRRAPFAVRHCFASGRSDPISRP